MNLNFEEINKKMREAGKSARYKTSLSPDVNTLNPNEGEVVETLLYPDEEFIGVTVDGVKYTVRLDSRVKPDSEEVGVSSFMLGGEGGMTPYASARVIKMLKDNKPITSQELAEGLHHSYLINKAGSNPDRTKIIATPAIAVEEAPHTEPTPPLSTPVESVSAPRTLPKVEKTSVREPYSEPAPKPEPRVETKKDLDALRKAFISAKKKLEDYSGIKKFLKLTDSKELLQANLDKAQKEYERTRAEFVGSELSRHAEEQAKFLENYLQRESRKGKGIFEKVQKFYGKLGEAHLGKFYTGDNAAAKFVLSKMNVRTAINLSLWGIASSSGVGAAVAVSATLARRSLSGGGTTVGAYGGLNFIKEKVSRRRAEKPLQSLEKLGESITRMVVKARESGMSLEDLSKDLIFQDLIDRQNKLLLSRYEDRISSGVEVDDLFTDQFKLLDKSLSQKLKNERKIQGAIKVFSVAAGAIVGGGILAKGIHKLFETNSPSNSGFVSSGHGNSHDIPRWKNVSGHSHTPEVTKPSIVPVEQTPAPSPVAEANPNTVTPHVVTVESEAPALEHPELQHGGIEVPPEGVFDQPVEVTVGDRGVEGVLLDALKDSKNERILNWLHTNFDVANGNNDPGALVHRYILDHGGIEEWNSIGRGAVVEMGPDGSLSLHAPTFEQLHNLPITHKELPLYEVSSEMPVAPGVNHLHEFSQSYIDHYGQENYDKLMHNEIVESWSPQQKLDSMNILVEQSHIQLQQIQDLNTLHEQVVGADHVTGTEPWHPSGARNGFGEEIGKAKPVSPAAVEAVASAHETSTVTDEETYQKMFERAAHISKASDALHSVLNEGQYDQLIKDMDITSGKLNKIGKMTLSEFERKYMHGGKFGKEYTGVYKVVEGMKRVFISVDDSIQNALQKMNMKEFLIQVALNRKE